MLQLEEFAHRKTKTYSGGQLRRLNVACGIVHRPEVLFLDEPTTGLDPQNRANLWVLLRELRDAGTTIFLTTHYLEEADVLSDRLAIMDNGKIVAEGTPRELKAQIAGDAIVVRPRIDVLDLDAVRTLLAAQSFVLDALSKTTGCVSTSATVPRRSRNCSRCSKARASSSKRCRCHSPHWTTSSCCRPAVHFVNPAERGGLTMKTLTDMRLLFCVCSSSTCATRCSSS